MQRIYIYLTDQIHYLSIFLLSILTMSACSSLPKQHEKTVSTFLSHYQANNYLARQLSPLLKKHADKTGFFLIANGVDAFAIRSALIKKSQSKLDIQYYMIHEDQSGRQFFNLLRQAATRGVKVRLLVDDIHLDAESKLLKQAAAHPNIEVRIFNPFNRQFSRYPQFAFQLGKITRRMHNKALTADNQISIIGGRNIADEYFQRKPEVSFDDMDAVFIGKLVNKVGQQFDHFWNSPQVERLDNLEKLPTMAFAVDASLQATKKEDNYYIHAIESGTLPFFWAKAHLIADHPDKILQKRHPKQFIKQTKISHYIDKVKKELLIFTPYLVPTATGIQYFKRLRQRGVRIILFTNSLATTDVPLVHSGYMNYRHALVELGVELYELKHVSRTFDLFKQLSNGKKVKVKKDSLHAKVMVFDRQAFYVGSMNIDPRSISENTELGLVIESAKVANSIYTWFEKNINQLAYRITLKDVFSQGKQVVWQSDDTQQFLINEPHTSLSRRIWMDFLRGLPIAEKHL